MKSRRAGLQQEWAHVVNSLQSIIPSYEKASSRISLFEDKRMRSEVVSFAVRRGNLVLDLGAGPGTLSRYVSMRGGDPVLVDVSGSMLRQSGFPNKVRGVFESLPFREGSFDAVVSGFALRDAFDLGSALSCVVYVLKPDGKFSFCDLGKPSNWLKSLAIGVYLRIFPSVIGLMTAGKSGVKYGSLFDTYALLLPNSALKRELHRGFSSVTVHETQLGGSVVVACLK